MSASRINGSVQVLHHRYRRFGAGPLDVARSGTVLASLGLPGLAVTKVLDLPVGRHIGWGSALVTDGGHTYVYGTSAAPGSMTFAHVARAAALDGQWEYWDGRAWSADVSAATRLLSGVGADFGVQRVGDGYVLVTREHNAVLDPRIVAYTAPTPTGPFTGPIQLLTPPEHGPLVVGAVRLHPGSARPGTLLLSYDLNSLDDVGDRRDVRLRRPRFVEVGWPPPRPDPAAAPPAPGGLVVSTDDRAVAHLSWRPVDGAAGYRVHRRAVTSGQSHFVPGAVLVTSASADVGGLISGQRYEFRVTACDATGEGGPSELVSVTPRKPADATVILGSGHPRAVMNSYAVHVVKNPASVGAGMRAFASDLLAQYGGVLGATIEYALWAFTATMTEAQAVAIAGHPDVVEVGQDYEMDLLDS